jgi:hypothetical protein
VSEGKLGKLTGELVALAVQSRKVLRMPWTVIVGSIRWQARRSAFSESGRPVGSAKTKSRAVELRGPPPGAKHAGFFSSDPGTA